MGTAGDSRAGQWQSWKVCEGQEGRQQSQRSVRQLHPLTPGSSLPAPGGCRVWIAAALGGFWETREGRGCEEQPGALPAVAAARGQKEDCPLSLPMHFWPGGREAEQLLLTLPCIPCVPQPGCEREVSSSFGDIQASAARCCKHPDGNRRQTRPGAHGQAE